MAFSNWRLCAGLLPPFNDFVLVSFVNQGSDWYIFYPPVFLDDRLLWVVYTSGHGPGHFPYGIAVEPDHD